MNKKIILGGGCFWCVESAFKRLKGITNLVSGYANGKTKDPTYKEICGGETGHAEVVKVEFDPQEINLETILDVFFTVHDPTTLNRQGNDVGTQYRSIIIFSDKDDKDVILKKMSEVSNSKLWNSPLVTEVETLDSFYEAELYHQDYFNNNPGNPYCQAVIPAKISKLENRLNALGKKSILV